jgi:hypothetical protein
MEDSSNKLTPNTNPLQSSLKSALRKGGLKKTRVTVNIQDEKSVP